MAKLSGQTGLTLSSTLPNLGTDGNVWIDYTGKLIHVAQQGSLDDGGVTLQALYSFIMKQWKDNNFEMYKFPLYSVTPGEFELQLGWDFADDTTRYLIRDAGWNLLNAGTSAIEEVWMGFKTLGTIDDVNNDQVYFIHTADGTPTNFQLTGVVNQAVKIYGDVTHGNFDYRLTSNSRFVVFLREQGKTYDSYDLNTQQDFTELKNNVYAAPLGNGTDLDIEATDAYVSFSGTTSGAWSITGQNTISTTNLDFTGLAEGDRIVVTSTANTDTSIVCTITTYTDANNIVVDGTPLSNDSGSGAEMTVTSVHQSMSLTWFPDLSPSDSDFSNLDTITCADQTFVTSGYEVGHKFRIAGSTSNDGVYTIESLTETSITIVETFAANDTNDASVVINQAREIGTGNYYDYRIIIDANGGTLQEIYEFIQWSLRQAGDIDDGPGTEVGRIKDEMLAFVGPTLKTKSTTDGGVFIDGFLTADTNSIVFVDDTGAERTFPYVAAGRISFNDNLVADVGVAKYWMYFANAGGNLYDTPSAVIVHDNGGSDITGTVTAQGYVDFDYDYEGNNQGGRTPNTDAAIILIAIGSNNAKYVSATGTLTRSTLMSFTLTAEKERNYVA